MKEINELIFYLKHLIKTDPILQSHYDNAKKALKNMNIFTKMEAAEKLKDTFL